MSFQAISWLYTPSEDWGGGHPCIQIDRCKQINGSVRYAVRQAGACMDKDGNWMREPMPSSRDDEFLDRFRFDYWEQAADAILKHCKTRGRFEPGIKTSN